LRGEMANGCVISARELERMHSIIAPRQQPRSSSLDNESLHKLKSRERVSTWKNTLLAQRKVYEKEREDRLRNEELERRRIDVEEAHFQFEERKRVIDRANAMLAGESERMRNLTSSLMLSDVLAERDNQIRIKQDIAKLENIRNIKYDQLVKHNCSEMKKRELEECTSRRRSASLTAQAQIHQMLDLQHQRLAALDARKKERVKMIHLNQIYENEALDRKDACRAKAIEANYETESAQEYMTRIRKRDEERIRKEEETILKYADQKDDLGFKIKQHRQDMLDERLRAREAIAAAASVKEEYNRWPNPDSELNVSLFNTGDKDLRDVGVTKRLSHAVKHNTKHRIEDHMRQRIGAIYSRPVALNIADRLAYELEDIEAEIRERKKDMENGAIHVVEEQVSARCVTDKHQRHMKALVDNAKSEERAEFEEHAAETVKEYKDNGRNIVPIMLAIRDYKKNPDA
jgi:hypothetical protein